MIRFRQMAQSIDFRGVDTLMFTSKQAVYTADKIDRRWRDFDSIAIGPATKKSIIDNGGKLLFQPKEFYGESLALGVLERFKDRKILYLRPKKIIFDSCHLLSKYGVEIREQVIYETECRSYSPLDKPPKNSIIIFTSPSTIKCFLKNFGWESSFTAIVIGNSTKEHLIDGSRFLIAKEPTIDSCIDRAKEFNLIGSKSRY
jgi:uroporphyrinogen-III synthase